jgi:hypothetical protein
MSHIRRETKNSAHKSRKQKRKKGKFALFTVKKCENTGSRSEWEKNERQKTELRDSQKV